MYFVSGNLIIQRARGIFDLMISWLFAPEFQFSWFEPAPNSTDLFFLTSLESDLRSISFYILIRGGMCRFALFAWRIHPRLDLWNSRWLARWMRISHEFRSVWNRDAKIEFLFFFWITKFGMSGNLHLKLSWNFVL